jgi:hypothetical protein
MLDSLQASCFAGHWIVYKREDNLMSWITLQTTSGPENGMIAVGYMDMISGLISLSDLEECRMKRPEIVHESLGQQPTLLPKANVSL